MEEALKEALPYLLGAISKSLLSDEKTVTASEGLVWLGGKPEGMKESEFCNMLTDLAGTLGKDHVKRR